ncbi:MAG: hypothetical protein JRH20_28500 [Deltaproteobacteria bacterium]|nr:hypothetical protein [Deltaproteobacteria bacterium]
MGCTLLGSGYWRGKDGPLGLAKSAKKAKSYHRRAWQLTRKLCEAGDARSCSSVGSAYGRGHTGHRAGSGIRLAKDEKKALRFQRRACEQLDYAEACRALAFKLYNTDRPAAQKFRRRACRLGMKAMCP